jgi:hypothetical protein
MHEFKKTATSRRWHFDALSDDGREAVVIEFTDNYHLSRRFASQRNGPVPAVSLRYFFDGKLVLSSINEVPSERFISEADGPVCVAGDSSFRIDAASYGSGFMVVVDLLAARKRHIIAELEWLSVEGNIAQTTNVSPGWKMTAPRSDVSGRISLVARQGVTRKLIQFRGTGYTDELVEADRPRAWGRAHYVDATENFQTTNDGDNGDLVPTLYLVRDAALREHKATVDIQHTRRDRYGLKIPGRFQFKTRDNVRLRVKPVRMIESGFFEARMLSEITLMLRDGKPRKTIGITEFSDPTRVSNPFFRLLSDLRIGKNGRPPLL